MTDNIANALTRRELRKKAREQNAVKAAQQDQDFSDAVTAVQIAGPSAPRTAPAQPSRAAQRKQAEAQAKKDAARVAEPAHVDFRTFRSRKPTLHELNQLAKDAARQTAEEARIVASAAAKAAHGAYLGVRPRGAHDAFTAKHAAQVAQAAAQAAAAAAKE